MNIRSKLDKLIKSIKLPVCLYFVLKENEKYMLLIGEAIKTFTTEEYKRFKKDKKECVVEISVVPNRNIEDFSINM